MALLSLHSFGSSSQHHFGALKVDYEHRTWAEGRYLPDKGMVEYDRQALANNLDLQNTQVRTLSTTYIHRILVVIKCVPTIEKASLAADNLYIDGHLAALQQSSAPAQFTTFGFCYERRIFIKTRHVRLRNLRSLILLQSPGREHARISTRFHSRAAPDGPQGKCPCV